MVHVLETDDGKLIEIDGLKESKPEQNVSHDSKDSIFYGIGTATDAYKAQYYHDEDTFMNKTLPLTLILGVTLAIAILIIFAVLVLVLGRSN